MNSPLKTLKNTNFKIHSKTFGKYALETQNFSKLSSRYPRLGIKFESCLFSLLRFYNAKPYEAPEHPLGFADPGLAAGEVKPMKTGLAASPWNDGKSYWNKAKPIQDHPDQVLKIYPFKSLKS